MLGAPHILPVLFQFTIPAKFCFRAIASFDRFMTDMKTTPPTTSSSSLFRRKTLFTSVPQQTESNENFMPILDDAPITSTPLTWSSGADLSSPVSSTGQSSFRRVVASRVTQAGSFLRRQQTQKPGKGSLLMAQSGLSNGKQVSNSLDDIRSRAATQIVEERSQRMAGESRVYEDIKVRLHL